MINIKLLNDLCKTQMLKSVPILYKYSLKESIVRILLIVLNKSKVININEYFWHTALLTIGKERYYKLVKDKEIINELDSYYKNILKKKEKGYTTIQVVDQIMNLYTLLYLKYEFNVNEYDSLIKEGIKLIDNITKDNEIIYYRNTNKNLILIDTLGMICPFLMRYSYYTGEKKYGEIAVNQLVSFIQNGVNEEDYFPYHSYNLTNKSNHGSSEWGRGIGWLLIGIVDSMEYIDKESKEYSILKEYLNSFLPNLIKYQDNNGYFKCNIREYDSHKDSSATAFIGYSIMRAIELKIINEDYKKYVEKACSAINKSMDEKGRVWDCSEDCGGIGQYSMKFSCNLSNGISLALISTYLKNIGGKSNGKHYNFR